MNVYKECITHLEKVDPVLASLAKKVKLDDHKHSTNYFVELCDTIVSQQLSVKVATVLFDRFKLLFPTGLTPENVLAMPEATIRAQGISYAKIRSMKNLSTVLLDGTMSFSSIPAMTDQEIVHMLILVKGIGRWTAEMFLIFTLGRPDVFSTRDLGLKKAVQKLYGYTNLPTVEELEMRSQIWSPYRSLASRILWKSLDSSMI